MDTRVLCMGHRPFSSADGAEGGDGSGGEEGEGSGFGGGGIRDRQGEEVVVAIGEREWTAGCEGRGAFRAAVELGAGDVECPSGNVEQAESTASGTVEERYVGGHSKGIVDGDGNATERETEPGLGGGDEGAGTRKKI